LSLLLLLNTVSAFAQLNLPAANAPKEYELGGITISGIQFLDQDILKTYSGLTIGQKISIPGEEIGKGINALWKQGLFANISVSIDKIVGNTIFLNFHLTERPRLASFSFKGISKGDAEDLAKKVNLIKGKVLTDNLLVNANTSIQLFFEEKGFSGIKTNIIQKKDSSLRNSVAIVFDISKGKKIRIDEIIVEGNQAINAAHIERLMKETKERFRIRPFTHKDIVALQHTTPKKIARTLYNATAMGLFDELRDRFRLKVFSGSKFNKDLFNDDKQKIIDYYNSKGFRDAQIVKDTVYKNETGNLVVKIKIDEGHPYYFRHIYWKGNTKYSDQVLASILAIKSGDIYDKNTLDAHLNMNQNGNDVSSLYMDDGYLFFQITPSEVAVDHDSIDMAIRVYEGPQAIINKVIIKGNEKTNEHVIRREIRTLPGQKFSRSDILRSQREIATLGYFNAEKIGITPIPHPETGTVDIEYTVEEKSSDQIELQAGWGGKATGLIGTVGVAFNNFSIRNITKGSAWNPLPAGDGQKLGLRIQSSGKYYQAGTFSFTEPWLGGKKPTSLSIALFQTAFNTTYLNAESKQTTQGVTIGIGKRLKVPDDYFTLLSNLNFEHYNLVNQSPAYFFLKNGVANNFNLEEVISRNSLSDPLYPRNGSKYTLTVKVTPPYSMFNKVDYVNGTDKDKYNFIEYHRWRFNAENYTKLWGNLVLKTAAKFGFLGNYTGKTGDSPFERFEVGGDGISNFRQYGKEIIALRGYEVADVFQNKTTGNSTSTLFNKFTMELRFPFTLNPSSTIYALAFVDGATANIGFKNYNPFDLKRAAGLGIRVFLPMFGLLGVDYGIGFDKGSLTTNKLSNLGKFSIILGYEPE
jgi:outer membrane protein insertion porin family